MGLNSEGDLGFSTSGNGITVVIFQLPGKISY